MADEERMTESNLAGAAVPTATLDSEPVSYMVATRGSGALLVPMAFRGSLEEAERELAYRQLVYPNARVFALHEVGEHRG